MNFIGALGQALDFFWKAAKAYSETPEGAKELNDVIVALEGTDNSQTASAQTVNSSQPASRYSR